MVLLQALNSNQNSQLRSHTVECASNMAAYLRDYALHCCQVFQHPSNVKDYPAKQAKVWLLPMLVNLTYLRSCTTSAIVSVQTCVCMCVTQSIPLRIPQIWLYRKVHKLQL